MNDRMELAVRIQAMLLQFWVAEDTEDAIRVIELETWLDTLGGISPDEFRHAVVDYNRTGPRTGSGRLVKPDPGAIWRLISQRRAADFVEMQRSLPPPPPPPPKVRVTKEQAAAILKEAFGRRFDVENGWLIPPIIKRFRDEEGVAGEP